jgi:hypothetical protein
VGEKVSNLVANGLSNSVQNFLDEVSNLGIPSLIKILKYTTYAALVPVILHLHSNFFIPQLFVLCLQYY